MRATVRRSARALVVPLSVYLVSRVVVLVALGAAGVLVPGYDPGSLRFDWDAQHYLYIAEHGYPPLYPPEGGYLAHTAFFPLLPWATRALDLVTPFSLRTTATLVAQVSGALAAVMVWLLARETVGGDRRAAIATAFVVLWPASVVFSMFYTDALFVALGAACLLALRRRWWLAAGAAAMFASALRPTGAALGAACAWAAVAEIASKRTTGSLRSLIAPALAPLGGLAYFTFLYVKFDDFFLWFEAEEVGWGGGFDFGRHFVSDHVMQGLAHPVRDFGLFVSGVAGLCVLALLVWAIVDRLPAEHVVMSAVVVVLALGTGFGASVPRYLLGAFPLAFVPARRLPDLAAGGVAMVAAAGLAVFTLVIALTRVVAP
ncbi:MAG TPA: glycosyltransferase family 39 protein [Acidimicrobiales bacterium]|nr:glycosyltransferase family 39 protein [Acidimicrobiales bacterium]